MLNRLDRILTIIIAFLSGTNERTWLGHGIQGLLLGFLLSLISPVVAISFVAGAFWHREISDFVEPVYEGRLSWSGSLKRIVGDGIMDFLSPLAGAGIGILLNAALL